MSKTVDFYFTPVSPWTYLGMPRFRAMCAKYNATVNYKPVDMAPLFGSAGVKAVKDRPEPIKRNRLNELRRWREYLGMPLNIEPKFFPVPSLLAAKMIVAAKRAGHDAGALAEAFLHACWAEDRNVADKATAIAIAEGCGLDGAALCKQADDPAVQAEFEANTQEALSRSVWGSPSYVIDGELFFGQDRLIFVERKLAQS